MQALEKDVFLEFSSLIQQVKKIRVRTNLTQEDVAKIFGIKENTYARWERLELTPHPKNMEKIREFIQKNNGHFDGHTTLWSIESLMPISIKSIEYRPVELELSLEGLHCIVKFDSDNSKIKIFSKNEDIYFSRTWDTSKKYKELIFKDSAHIEFFIFY